MHVELPLTQEVAGYTFTYLKLEEIPEELEIEIRETYHSVRPNFLALECREQIYFVHIIENDSSVCRTSFWKLEHGEWCGVGFHEHHFYIAARLSTFAHCHLKG